MTVWFTSDLHFSHANVIKYSNRPFKDVKEMNEAMILKWNTVVKPGDRVYVLGDASFDSEENTLKILKRLMGQKYLIYGNHDKKVIRKSKILQDQFVWCRDLETIKISDKTAYEGKQRIVLCHYAMRVWEKSHFGAWQLYGHSHGNLKDDPNALQLDVGVDNWGYTPVSYETIKKEMKRKTFVPVDHHKTREQERDIK